MSDYIAECVAEGRTLIWVTMIIGVRYQSAIHEDMFPFRPEEAMSEIPGYLATPVYPDDTITLWLVEVDTRDVVAVFDRMGVLITTDLSDDER